MPVLSLSKGYPAKSQAYGMPFRTTSFTYTATHLNDYFPQPTKVGFAVATSSAPSHRHNYPK